MWNNRVVFLDEPTAALGVAQTRQVLALEAARGTGACGRLRLAQPRRHLRGFPDRITVLRLGRNVGVYEKAGDQPAGDVQAITAGKAAPEEAEVAS